MHIFFTPRFKKFSDRLYPNQPAENETAFTLIELLVVIAIISLISVITLVLFNNIRARARDSNRLNDIIQIEKALEMYFDENDRYPNYRALTGNSNCGTNWCALETSLTKYLPRLPRDPLGNQTTYRYYYNSDAADNNATFGLMVKIEARQNYSLVAGDGGYAGYANINNGQYYERGNQPSYCMSKYTGGNRNWWENTANVCTGGN